MIIIYNNMKLNHIHFHMNYTWSMPYINNSIIQIKMNLLLLEQIEYEIQCKQLRNKQKVFIAK